MIFETNHFDSLVAKRRELLESDIEWNDNGRSAQRELDRINFRILEIDFRRDVAFLAAAKLLVSGTANPNFADAFQNDLFEALRNAAR